MMQLFGFFAEAIHLAGGLIALSNINLFLHILDSSLERSTSRDVIARSRLHRSLVDCEASLVSQVTEINELCLSLMR